MTDKTPDAFERQLAEIERLRQVIREYHAKKLAEIVWQMRFLAGFSDNKSEVQNAVKIFNAQSEKIIYGK